MTIVALVNGVMVGALAAGTLGVVGAVLLGLGASIVVRDRAIGRWPKVPGVIVSSSYACSEGVSRVDNVDLTTTTFTAAVTYRYTIDGKSLVGTRVARLPVAGPADHVKRCIDRYPAGAKVDVLVDRVDPSTAYLERCTSGGAILLIVMGGFFALMGLGGGALILRA